MLNILAAIVGLGPTLLNFANKITDLKIAQVNAGADVQKAAIDAQIEEVHDKRAVLIAEVGNRITAVAVSTLLILFGLAAAIVFWKLTVWDKVIGSFLGYTHDVFTTDGLSSDLWTIILAIVSLITVSNLGGKWLNKRS